MLKLPAYKPESEHAEYYSRFVLAVKPNIKSEFIEAGIFKARNREFDFAIEIFKAIRGMFPECAKTRLNLAVVYEDASAFNEQNGKLDLAEAYTEKSFQAYKDAERADPQLPYTHFNFAHFFLSQKNFQNTLEHFHLFLRLVKQNQALLSEYLDQTAEHIRTVEGICAEIESWDDTDRLFKEAFDLIKLNRKREGVERISAFLEKKPDVWNVWFLRGWGHQRLNQYAEAKEAFMKALEKWQGFAIFFPLKLVHVSCPPL